MTDRNFFEKCWRRRPVKLPALLDGRFVSGIDAEEFAVWSLSAPSARLYTGSRMGTKVERLAPASAPVLARRIVNRQASGTLLLNGLEQIAPVLRDMRHAMNVGRTFRYDDIVATLSSAGRSIGYHAGHEDGFVVQVAGARRWRVWPATVTRESYKRHLLGDKRARPRFHARPQAPPIVDCILHCGDILYIPPFHGHEGTTTEAPSLSISLAWRGISVFHILSALAFPARPVTTSLTKAVRRDLFSLLPDPEDGVSPVAGWFSHTEKCLNRAGYHFPSHVISAAVESAYHLAGKRN